MNFFVSVAQFFIDLLNMKVILMGLYGDACILHAKNIKRYLIRINSFFENFNISMLLVLKVLIRYSCKTRRHAMIQNFSEINRSTIYKILNKLVSLIPTSDFSSEKLGGPNRIVQINETMLNFKCKSHRGRSPENKTDALCIVEYKILLHALSLQ
ncbi:hypothetical protein GVAV_002278 [Gurleya vavrai]